MEKDIISSINGLKVPYKCEKCGYEKDVPIFPYISFEENPEYYALVKNLDIFKVKCEKCGYEEYIKFDSLIVDPMHKYFIYLFCDSSKVDMFRKNVDYFVNTVLNASEIKDWNQIETRLVLDLNDLIEKMTIFELGLNDKAIEFIKCGLIEKNIIDDNSKIFFDGIEQLNLKFVSFLDEKMENINISIDFYNKIIENINNLNNEKNNFELIDRNWVNSKI